MRQPWYRRRRVRQAVTTAAGLLLATASGSALAAEAAKVESGTITYHVTHRFKAFDAVVAATDADLLLAFDEADPGALTFAASIPLGAFDSSNQLRDEHAAEALELFLYPVATWTADRVEVVSTGATIELRVSGPLTLHGVTATLTAPVTVTVGGGEIRFQSAFDLSLEAHGIPRPGLLGFKIEDTVNVTVDLRVAR